MPRAAAVAVRFQPCRASASRRNRASASSRVRGRVDPAATAFPHRRAAFGLHIFPGWREPADDAGNIAWASSFCAEMASHATGGVYVNMLGGDEPERIPAAWGVNYARLRELKRRFDPENLFRSNHNIRPAD